MWSGVFLNYAHHQVGAQSGGLSRGLPTNTFPGASRSGAKGESRVVARCGNNSKRSRIGQAFLFHMLITGSTSTTKTHNIRQATTASPASRAHHAVVLEDEQSPQPRSITLNGVTDDWSVPQSTRDWDGQEISENSTRLPAVAGLLAVAGAGYVCTQLVGALMNRRSDLARIVPHPVAFSSTSSTEAASPRSSLEYDSHPNLKSRPLSPDAIDRSTSPIHSPRMHRSTSMTGFVDTTRQMTDVEDDSASVMTSAADAVEVESAASSFEVSDFDSIDSTLDHHYQNLVDNGRLSDVSNLRSISPEMLEKLPYEYTMGSMRERAQLAMRAASAATEAAQRASAFSAAASTAATTAANASKRAMTAASLAHIALESGNIEQMTTAQASAWKEAQLAAEAERKSANAAVLATAYEDHAEQQAKVARELSILPSRGVFRPIIRNIKSFVKPITTTIGNITNSIIQGVVAVWTYFASGMFWNQICSFAFACVSFVQNFFISIFTAIQNGFLFIVHGIASFVGGVYNGVKNGVISTYSFARVFFTRLFSPKGPFGGSSTTTA